MTLVVLLGDLRSSFLRGLTSEKQVLVALGIDKPEALVRESLNGAFCHLSNSSNSVLQR